MSIGVQCFLCKHYIGVMRCKAFPEKIPEEIMTGFKDHSKPYPGDNGIRYEPVHDEKGGEDEK